MVKMNIFQAARHEVRSISIKQLLRGCFNTPHVAKRPSKRSALVYIYYAVAPECSSQTES